MRAARPSIIVQATSPPASRHQRRFSGAVDRFVWLPVLSGHLNKSGLRRKPPKGWHRRHGVIMLFNQTLSLTKVLATGIFSGSVLFS
jgi:hypothetical protein